MTQTPPGNYRREMHHFLLLSPAEQLAAIRRLAALGWSDYAIASATRLSVEQIRRLIADETGSATPSEQSGTGPLSGSPARPKVPDKIFFQSSRESKR